LRRGLSTRSAKCGWRETVLANFNGANESSPLANVVFADHGKLVETTQTGGSGYGTVFALTPPGAGATTWTQTTLYSFPMMEVGFPQSAVLPGPKDALYGTTTGSFEHPGEMFAITH
jgi:hypothetical protein